MYCIKCGSHIPDDSVFCASCGCEQIIREKEIENLQPPKGTGETIINDKNEIVGVALAKKRSFFDKTYEIGNFLVSFFETIIELGMFILGVLLLLGVLDSWF